jgi:prostaglandin-E synthase
VLIPQVTWAQREDVLYVTVQLSDVKDERITLDENKLTFSAIAGVDAKPYAVEMEFYGPVDPQVCPIQCKKFTCGSCRNT